MQPGTAPVPQPPPGRVPMADSPRSRAVPLLLVELLSPLTLSIPHLPILTPPHTPILPPPQGTHPARAGQPFTPLGDNKADTVPSLGPNPTSPFDEPRVPSQPLAGSSPPPPPPPTAGTSTGLGVAAVGEVAHEGTVGQDLPGRAGDAQHGHGLQQDPVEVGACPQELAEHGALRGQGGCHPALPGPSHPARAPAARRALPHVLPVCGAPSPGKGCSAAAGEGQSHLSEGRGWRASAAGARRELPAPQRSLSPS